MIRFNLTTFMEDSRRLGVVMLAAGLIGYFIEPVKPGALAAASLGILLVLIGNARFSGGAKTGDST